jgi:hypothetical protein
MTIAAASDPIAAVADLYGFYMDAQHRKVWNLYLCFAIFTAHRSSAGNASWRWFGVDLRLLSPGWRKSAPIIATESEIRNA